MVKKSFFKNKTPEEMRELFKVHRVYTSRNLVERIWNLDSESESIELRTPIIPANFLVGLKSQAQASRKNYKHGLLIHLNQPNTREEAYNYPYTPLTARMKAFDEVFRNLREEEINFIGITWHPLQTRDRRWRIAPFDVSLEGTKIYNYAVNRTPGIEVKEYTEAEIIKREGGQILCKVPSRTKRKERYQINLMNIPVIQDREKNAIIWSIKSQYIEGKEPERTTFLHHLRYELISGTKGSDVFVFGPHEIAAYLAIIKKCWQGLNNTVPLEMNPFPLPSKAWARFYDKLNNNIMIYDPTLSSKEKLRNLHLDEKCILLGRSIKVKGAYETAFWDPARDGHLKSYWK